MGLVPHSANLYVMDSNLEDREMSGVLVVEVRNDVSEPVRSLLLPQLGALDCVSLHVI
jgi:hypothetical protein